MVIFLLMVYRLPEWATLVIIAVASVLTFMPVEFIHPVRVRRLRPLTLAMTGLWGVFAILALADNLSPGPVVLVGLAITTIYAGAIGPFLQLTREGTA